MSSFCAKNKSSLVINTPPLLSLRNVCASGSIVPDLHKFVVNYYLQFPRSSSFFISYSIYISRYTLCSSWILISVIVFLLLCHVSCFTCSLCLVINSFWTISAFRVAIIVSCSVSRIPTA